MQSPTPFNSPTLYQDIVDLIIEFLDGDIPSLRSCSLVCRLWEQNSRPRLFSKIILGDPHDDKMFPILPSEFHESLISSPHIGAHVRHLVINPQTNLRMIQRESGIFDPIISQTFDLLQNVRTLTIGLESLTNLWVESRCPFNISVGRLLHTPSLVDVTLRNITFSAFILGGLPQLQRLKLCNVGLIKGGSGKHDSTPKTAPAHLSLIVGPPLNGLLSALNERVLDFSQLKSLELFIKDGENREDQSQLRQLMQSAPRLEHLQFRVYVNGEEAPFTWIPPLPRLRELEMATSTSLNAPEDNYSLQWLTETLRHIIISSSSVSVITLRLVINRACLNEALHPDWSPLDEVIAHEPSLLKSVVIFAHRRPDCPMPETVVEVLQARFRALAEKGVFKI